MAKRKAGKSPGAWRRFFHFFTLTPVRRTLLLIVIVGLLWWQWPAITTGVTQTVDAILRLFGWGIVFIPPAIAGLVVLLFKRDLKPVLRHGHRWLGAIAFVLAAWGVLGLVPGAGILEDVSLGGRVGQGITGYPATAVIGILRILGLAVLGIILVIPVASYRAAVRSSLWLGSLLKRRLAHKPRPAQPASPPFSAPPAPRRERESPRQPGPTSAIAPPATQPELRQVAQEVWRKYGESPDLVTVDGWKLPPIDILDRSPEVEMGEADNLQRARLIEEALASYGVESKVVQINAGPTVTQFGVEPGWDRRVKDVKEKDKNGNVEVRQEEVSRTRVKVERITSLASDLALALAATSIRIEAPIPGKSMVGIEVPNTVSSVVSLRGVIETSSFQKTIAKSKLALALGKGAGGEAIGADLSKMPHLLIAGATGSGKTVCLNATICCLLLHNTPNDVRFMMVDPKRVELTEFNSIPHLVTPVIVDANKALGALRWLNNEMDRRYKEMASVSARNIEGYNKNRQGDEKMPFLVLIIDELADLMMTSSDEVERILCRLAQLARAVGIHLVVATQRPSVDVVTGLIKANFPTRISFAVTSQVDSRTILDGAGAEKLLGKGDMLFMPTDAAKPRRLQGCFVADAEIERLVYFWSNQRQREAVSLKLDDLPVVGAGTSPTEAPEDPLLVAARQLLQEHTHVSTSFLQRKLRIGYPRAARLMEELGLEKEGGEEHVA